MTERNIILWLQYAVAIILIFFVVFAIMTSNQNLLGSIILYFIPAAVILGFSNPRMGFFVLLIISAYIEQYKRLTSIATNLSGLDVMIILALPPALLGAIVAGMLYRILSSRDRIQSESLLIPALCTGLVILGFCGLYFRSGLTAAARFAINGSAYSFLVFIIPNLFPTYKDISKLLITMIVIYIPVAVYGIWQSFFGFADFEIEYILSGHTSLIIPYYYNDLRPFSTLSSPDSFSFSMSIFAIFCLVFWIGRRVLFENPSLLSHLLLLGFIFFSLACFFSYVRAAYIVIPLSLYGFIMFRWRWSTCVYYFTAIGSFLVLISFSEYFIRNLSTLQNQLFQYAGSESRLLTIGTLHPRLSGYQKFFDWDHYTPFGMINPPDTHDNLSKFLTAYGVIPTSAIIILIAAALYYSHSYLLRIPDKSIRSMAALLVSIFITIMLAGILVGGVNFVFPTNLLWWSSIGLLIAIVNFSRKSELQ